MLFCTGVNIRERSLCFQGAAIAGLAVAGLAGLFSDDKSKKDKPKK